MKLPKFIKSTQQSASKKKFVGGDQLLLTESTYSVMSSSNKFFTPQKRVAYIINDYKYINDKTYNLVTPQQQQNKQADFQLESTPFKAMSANSPSFANLFQLKTPITASTKHANFLDSVASSPRYVKSASTKRLQRNRLQHVKSKPTNYMLRSSVMFQNSLVEQTQINGTGVDCFDSFVTPIKPVIKQTLTKAAAAAAVINEEESLINSNKSIKFIDTSVTVAASAAKTAVINNLQSKSIAVTTTTNPTTEQTAAANGSGVKRFSLSKLTKFVSQSALKVFSSTGSGSKSNSQKKDRRSYGSNCSSLDLSYQTVESDNSDNEEQESPDTNQKQVNINLADQFTEKPMAISPSPVDSQSPLNKQPAKRRVPCMGVTSLMLKNIRNKSHNSYSTVNCQPSMYLVNMPIVFNSADLKEPIAKLPINKQPTSNNYDKLDRATLLTNTTTHTNRLTEPITKVTTPTTYLRHQTTCRISIFNGHSKVVNKKHYSASQLNESQTYDSIIC